ncbi:MAG TPA: helix-turn-helix transcriptional regulator [Candidatus Obscuribacterales bacterium]
MSPAEQGEIHAGIRQIGRFVALFRKEKGLTQQKLAEKLGSSDRNIITQLEQGRRLPSSQELESIGRLLEIPEERWEVISHPAYLQSIEFEEALSELLGKPMSLEKLDPISQGMLIQAVALFVGGARMSLIQAHDHFNSLLTFYGERAVSLAFYQRFLGRGNFDSVASFARVVHDFQKTAIRIYGSFRRAFKTLSVCQAEQMDAELELLRPVPAELFTRRRPFDTIRAIARDRLDDLGYISAERVRSQNRERSQLHRKLLELAEWIEKDPDGSILKFPSKKLHRIQTLLRTFESELLIEETLFTKVDPDELRREAVRLAPEDTELVRIAETQERGQQNLSAYLTEAYMDVYIATSMRERADFISVNTFVETVFSDRLIAPLHLRYFNPTLSWIADRVAKGLVEALMLKRARLTIYMAQKGDTFGKDSEASVALGQGKPVIVYVPRLYHGPMGINSEALQQQSEAALRQLMHDYGLEPDEDLDKQGLVGKVLTVQLQRLNAAQLAEVVLGHWADFDLYGELKDLHQELKHAVTAYLDELTDPGLSGPLPQASEAARLALIDKLVHCALFFEKRAYTFKEIHPLALQVILSSGVLNGIIVVRSAESCIKMLYELLTNTIETELVPEENNYRLVEKHTGSTLRVISKNKLLTNAFWTQYFD